MRGIVRIAAAMLVVLAASVCSAQKLSRITLTANFIPGGTPSSGMVELSDKAGKAPVVVLLSCSSQLITMPASVTIASGQSSVPFSITSVAVATDTTVLIKATVGSITTTANLIVQAPRITDFSFIPPMVQGGSQSTGTVKINTGAPIGGVKILLSSNTPYWGGPSSLVIPAGATLGTFSVTTIPVVGVTDAGVTALLSGVKTATALNITPARFQSFTIDHTSLIGGGSAIGTLTLDGPAPKEGFTVKVSSDSQIAIVPVTVKVLPGQTSVTFTITTKQVKTSSTARISGGGAGAMVQIPLAIEPPLASPRVAHGN